MSSETKGSAIEGEYDLESIKNMIMGAFVCLGGVGITTDVHHRESAELEAVNVTADATNRRVSAVCGH